MKKIKILSFIALPLFFVALCFLVGCSNESHDHNYSKQVILPTCVHEGYTKYTCECGDSYIDSKVSALGHNYKEEVIEPSCTEQGYTRYICECGDSYVDNKVSALGHSYGDWVTIKQASCIEEGQLIRICDICSYSESKAIEKNENHTVVIDEGKDPTCESAGLTEGKHCSVCNEVLIAQDIIPELGHSYKEEIIEPTCIEEGYTLYSCNGCGESYKTAYIETINHVFEHGACKMCNLIDSKSKNEEIESEKLRHEQELEDIEVFYNDIISGFEEEIKYLKEVYNISYVYSNSYCRQQISSLSEEMANLKKMMIAYQNSTNSSDIATYNKYKKQYDECASKINKYNAMIDINFYNDQINLYESLYEDAIIEENAQYNENIEKINTKYECAVAGHTIIIDEAVEPTCTLNGKTEGSHCENCGYIIVEQITIASLGHTEVVDQSIKETCTTDGKTEGKHCSVCGEILIEQEIIENHHFEVIDSAIEETCTADGKTEGKHCSECGEIIVAQEEIPAKGHTEVINDKVESTCTSTGLTEGSHCSECGEIIVAQEEIPAKGHTEVINDKVESTCTSTGLTEGSHCSECGEIIVAQEEIPAKGHMFVDFVCNQCGHNYYTEGLNFSLDEDGNSYCVSGYSGTDSIVVIPSIINDKPVTSIGDNAFDECSFLTEIIIPNSIINIGKFAFYKCTSLTHIIIPNSVTSIGNYAFEYCNSLISVKLSDNITNIGNSTFYSCTSLTNIEIPEGVTHIDKFALAGCRALTNVIIPNSVLTIEDYAFLGDTSLSIVYYTGTVEQWNNISIGTNNESLIEASLLSFTLTEKGDSYCVSGYIGNDSEVIIPSFYREKKVTKINANVFYDCDSLLSIEIPDSILNIDNYAFLDCSLLEEIIIPSSVTYLGDYAFALCSSLTSITIPCSVTYIGDYALYDSYNLKNINYDGTIEQWEDIQKGSGWNENVETYSIYCSNGTI